MQIVFWCIKCIIFFHFIKMYLAYLCNLPIADTKGSSCLANVANFAKRLPLPFTIVLVGNSINRSINFLGSRRSATVRKTRRTLV